MNDVGIGLVVGRRPPVARQEPRSRLRIDQLRPRVALAWREQQLIPVDEHQASAGLDHDVAGRVVVGDDHRQVVAIAQACPEPPRLHDVTLERRAETRQGLAHRHETGSGSRPSSAIATADPASWRPVDSELLDLVVDVDRRAMERGEHVDVRLERVLVRRDAVDTCRRRPGCARQAAP